MPYVHIVHQGTFLLPIHYDGFAPGERPNFFFPRDVVVTYWCHRPEGQPGPVTIESYKFNCENLDLARRVCDLKLTAPTMDDLPSLIGRFATEVRGIVQQLCDAQEDLDPRCWIAEAQFV